MNSKLRQAAQTINKLAKQYEDTHLALCQAVAAAQELVRRESNLSWTEWAAQNLRKPDGSLWSNSTLYTYASYGRNPEKLIAARHGVNRAGKTARQIANLAQVRVKGRHAAPSQKEIDHQVKALMFAWRNASPEARVRFLEQLANKNKAA